MESRFASWLNKAASRRWAAGLVLGIVLLSVYWPVFRFEYLYHDDWVHFSGHESSCSASPMYGWSMITGRPLGQYVLCGLFRVFDSVDHAWVARLIVVGGIAAFAWLQAIYFQALGIRWISSVALAFGASVLPGLLVFGYWITAGSIVSSLLASAGAVLLTHAACRKETRLAGRAALIAAAFVYQAAALLIYQTGAMYFWALTGLMLATMLSRGLRNAVRPLAIYTLVGAGSTIGYFIWFEYLSGLAALLRAQDQLRGTMVSDLPATAAWLLKRALPQASSLWLFDLPGRWGFVALTTFVASLTLLSGRMWWITWRQGGKKESLLYAAYPFVIAALGFLAYSPTLMTNFRAETFRSVIPSSALIFLTGAIHLGMLMRAERWPPAVRMCVAAGFVFGVSLLSSDALLTRMVQPAVAEYSFVRSSLWGAQKGQGVGRVRVVFPRTDLSPSTDEFGRLTIQRPHSVAPMIHVIGRELGLYLGVVSSSAEGEPFNREEALIIDYADLAKTGLWKTLAPLWLTISPESQDPQRPYGFVHEVNIDVNLHGTGDGVVRFTTDGTTPTVQSRATPGRIRLTRSAILSALAFTEDGPTGPVRVAEYKRLDEDGAVATGVKRGGERAEPVRVAVRAGAGVTLVVNDAEDGTEHDQGDWADAAFECSSGRVYLSQMQPEWARQGWGAPGKDKNLYGDPIKIGGQTYEHGLAASANAELAYLIPQGCQEFVAWVGVDDAAEGKGSVRFVVRQGTSEEKQPWFLRAYNGFSLVAFRGLIYGVPKSLGPVRWDSGTISNLPGAITGETVSQVINKLPSDMSMTSARFLRSHRGYSLVAYGGRVYGVPQTLGALVGADWDSGRVASLPGVVIEATLEEVLARLPR